jgi:hypothetical protein
MDFYKFTNNLNYEDINRQLDKSSTFNNKVIFVNGFNASGKTLFSPIISSIQNVELMTFVYEIEWCSSFLYSKNISSEAYTVFIKLYVDHLIYNQMMSRGINFRYSDLSSVFNSSAKWTYFKRLFQKGDNFIPDKIKHSNPILSLTTCHLLPFIPSLSQALQNRLLFVEIIRDPMFMVNQLLILHESIISRHSEKDFTIRVYSEGVDATYLDYYSSSEVFKNTIESDHPTAVISYLERMFDFYFNLNFENLEINKSSFMLIPFEKYVLSPRRWMDSIIEFTGSGWSKEVEREMKKQQVPRKLLSAGRKTNVYERFGWSEDKKSKTLEEENINYRNKIRKIICNDDAYFRLEKLSDRYHKWVEYNQKHVYINS